MNYIIATHQENEVIIRVKVKLGSIMGREIEMTREQVYWEIVERRNQYQTYSINKGQAVYANVYGYMHPLGIQAYYLSTFPDRLITNNLDNLPRY